jgi:predicted flap endonuclease-1-like 5' DNA nuclease
MNFWTGLILGIIIGWLVEWIIDWLFWRRDAEDAYQEEQRRAAEAVAGATDLEVEWADRLDVAQQEYENRLRVLEDEWQSRFDLSEQQWQSRIATLEMDNSDLRSRLADVAAGATLATAGAVAVEAFDKEAGVPVADETILDEDLGVTAILDEEVSLDVGAPEDLWPARLEMDAEVIEVPTRQDDLTRIKGIGPRYAQVLADGGIRSYDDLAATTPDQLRAIVKPGVMQQIDFDSWISQARAYAQTRGIQVGDDLTRLEGIGPTYAAKLREHGITTFAGLAATNEATLAEIINAPAWRRVNYADWIAQAQLAAAGDEAALQNLQERLYSRAGDNLSLIGGLGGRSAAALQAAGITTFAALAASTPEQLDAAIREAGVRGHFDYEAWISEAGLRAAGRRVPSKRARTTHIVSCPQDLSAVPGIGSIFEERLYAAGIGSYWELAETPRDELAATLGPESLHGVDLEAIKAAAVQMAAESNSIGRAWDGTPPDDFEVLPGIGEIYERRLYEAGICTYETLAATTVEQLTQICQAPPMRTPDYAAWIATAVDLSAAKRSG